MYTSTITVDERAAERYAYRQESEARRDQEALTNEHRRLAAAVTRRYSLIDGANGDDMNEAAFLGLVEAVALHDPSRGTSLTTFAWSHIHSRVTEYVRTIAPLATPHHIDELAVRVHRSLDTTAALNPTDESIALLLGANPDHVHAARNRPRGVALSTPIAEGQTLADLLPAATTYVTAALELADVRRELTAAVTALPPQQQATLLAYARTGSFTQTALELGIDKLTVRKYVRAARAVITAIRLEILRGT